MNLFAERIEAGNYSTLWVCLCCMLSEANGECCADPKHGGDGCEPLGLIPDTADVSLGLLAEEHNEGCTEADRSESGCECDQPGFSWARCDGCGSSLGGDRFGLTAGYDMR